MGLKPILLEIVADLLLSLKATEVAFPVAIVCTNNACPLCIIVVCCEAPEAGTAVYFDVLEL